MRSILPLILAAFLVAPTSAQVGHAIHPPDSPVYIDSLDTSNGGNGLFFEVSYRNMGAKDIVANELVFVSFGAFGEKIGYWNAVEVDSLRPTGSTGWYNERTWYAQTPRAMRHFRTVVFPRRARFEDGTIWHVDMKAIVDSVRQVLERPDLALPVDSLQPVQPKEEPEI